MAEYSKSQVAKELGWSKEKLEKKARDAGFKSTEAYIKANGGVSGILSKGLTDSITKEIIAIDRELDSLFKIGLTQEEKDQFLQRAITEVQPYYDSKKMELERGLQEGTIRTAEDVLLAIQNVELETHEKLAYYDLQTAQTEEEFINRLADITSSKDEDVTMKAQDWRDRIETVRIQQVQSGQFMGGNAIQKRKELDERKALELSSIERKAQQAATEEETKKKYDLESIRLARESAQQARISAIGSPVETEATKQSALSTLGYTDMSQMPSEIALQKARQERQTPAIYDKNVLTDLERNRTADVESTKLELEKQRLAEYQTSYEAQRQKLLADKAAKAAQLGTYKY